jgi:hypothetical protein
MIPIRKDKIKDKEVDVYRIKGKILDVDRTPKIDGTKKYKLVLDNPESFGIQYHKTGETSLEVGDEVEFDYYINEFNGVNYYLIIDILTNKDLHKTLTEFDKKKIEEKGFEISENTLSVSAKAILLGACIHKALTFEEGFSNFKRCLEYLGIKDNSPVLDKVVEQVSPIIVDKIEERQKIAKYLTDERLIRDNPLANKPTAMIYLGVDGDNYDKIKESFKK